MNMFPLCVQIYQQYPDTLLRGALARLRSNKMVSLKKHYNKSKLKEGNYLPLSSAPYQLSVTFSHIFLCRCGVLIELLILISIDIRCLFYYVVCSILMNSHHHF